MFVVCISDIGVTQQTLPFSAIYDLIYKTGLSKGARIPLSYDLMFQVANS